VRLPIERIESAPEILAEGQDPALSNNGEWLTFIREEQGRSTVWLLATDSKDGPVMVLPSGFWQPSLFYGQKPLVPFERQLPAIAAKDSWSLIITAVYREAETRATSIGNFIFLGSIFDSVAEPIYIDEGHPGPRGNELAAQAVAEYIENHPGN
jgi:hypothetical protein